MSERFSTDSGSACFAWPPFMIAQPNVLGKNYEQFRATLENPCFDEAKVFEALIQLAVLVRSRVRASGNLEALLLEVKARYKTFPEIVQVVAVPMYASFPTYDFFVLHREERNWKAVVGYQCKQIRECPSEDAWKSVAASVWAEGKCPQYRVQDGGMRVAKKKHKGWTMLSNFHQASMLGVTVAEALAPAPAIREENRRCCEAEIVWDRQHTDSRDSQSGAKGSN
eukprot:scaffold4511_cov171-Amphora_coffeaeformis.AAC.27